MPSKVFVTDDCGLKDGVPSPQKKKIKQIKSSDSDEVGVDPSEEQAILLYCRTSESHSRSWVELSSEEKDVFLRQAKCVERGMSYLNCEYLHWNLVSLSSVSSFT